MLHSLHRQAYPKAGQGGFTLLELAIVLAIVALVAGAGMMVGQSSVSNAQLAQTNTKLDTIEKALFAYRMANNRLPCPASGALPTTDTNYGVEAANAGSCTGGTPAANFTYTVVKSGTNVVEGAVPVRALNLPNTFMYDGWGRKIAYAVWTPMTAANAFSSYSINNDCGAITVQDASHNNRTTQADYALLSYGADGYGGYLASGARYTVGSDNTDEQKNAHTGAYTYSATYIQKDATADPNDAQDNFDDIVHYKERWQLQNASDQYSPTGGTPCTPGFIINGFMSNQDTGWTYATADINGDGIPDLIIGAPNATPLSNNQQNAGVVFVVFGTKNGFPDPLPLTSLNGTNGFELDGVNLNDWTGWSVATGDVNGDNTADIVIGAYAAGVGHRGKAYVVFGGATRKDGTAWSSCPCILNSTFLNGTNGAEFDSTTGEAGGSVAVVDLNNDTIPDIVIGNGAAALTSGASGSVYVVFGKKNGWVAATNLDYNLLNGTTGVEYDGLANTHIGGSLAGGKISGNSNPPALIIGTMSTGSSSAYVVFGNGTLLPSFTLAIQANPGTTSITPSTYPNLMVGQKLYAPGLTNGQYISSCNGGANTLGTVCKPVGGPLTLSSIVTAIIPANTTTINVASMPLTAGATGFLNGTNGTEFDGSWLNNALISLPIAVGDVNGDNIPDIIIGSYAHAVNGNGQAGSTYVIYGRTSGWPTSPANLTSGYIDGINGVEFDGATFNINSGSSVAAGDINGDNTADLLIGAFNAASGNGAAYVVFGKNPLLPQTTITTNAGSASATVASASGLMVGQTITASTLPTGTTIAAIISGTNITLSSGVGVTNGNNKPMYVAATYLNSTFLNGVYGSEFDGAAISSFTGFSVGACDLTGDGIPELVIGAYGNTVGGASSAGSTYVYYGKKSGWPTSSYGLGNL